MCELFWSRLARNSIPSTKCSNAAVSDNNIFKYIYILVGWQNTCIWKVLGNNVRAVKSHDFASHMSVFNNESDF